MRKAALHLHTEEIDFVCPFDRQHLLRWICDIARQESYQVEEITYIFCSDDYLLGINQEFLQHDFYTDIITFDNSEDLDYLTGDIFISVERVQDNARQLGLAFEDELLRVLAHGILHLCGYNDETEEEEQEMRETESRYMREFASR